MVRKDVWGSAIKGNIQVVDSSTNEGTSINNRKKALEGVQQK